MGEPIRINELIDVPGLQALMESLFRVLGLANAIIDVQGVVITQSGWQDLCSRFHRVHPTTCQRCIESDTSLATRMMQGERFAIYRCLNGLTDTAVPVMVAGQHVANLFTGQFFTAPPEIDFFRRQAAEFGFPEDDYLAAVARVLVVDRERIETIVTLYARLATLLAQAGYDRWQHKQAEAKLHDALSKLEERSRELEAANRELEEFSYSISHDLRTPLRAMAGFSEILRTEHAGENAMRLARLMEGIQEFISLGRRPLRSKLIDMNQLVQEAVAALRARFPRRAIESIVKPLPPARGDPALIRRVFDQLLDNTLRFTLSRALARIEVRGQAVETSKAPPAADSPAWWPAGRQNVYHVTDNGVGFDMRYAARLFRISERVHAPQADAGAGVGLAIVRRIVTRHGGNVHAEGQVGVGATFSFSLPAGDGL